MPKSQPRDAGEMVDAETYFRDHWVDIEADRLERYGQAFRINDRNRPRFVDPLGAQMGETVVDFGCGPGYVSAELAKTVGPDGVVHAMDLSADLLDMAREVVDKAGVSDRVRFHHITDDRIGLPDATVDRVVFKSVLLYVADVDATMAEAYRVLRPGGQVAAQDTDFWLSACTAFKPEEWRSFIDAARPAFADPAMGRHLRGALLRAGLTDVTTKVTAMTDDRGAMRGTVENFFGYVRALGTMPGAAIDDLARRADQAIEENRWLFVINFFQANGTKPPSA